MPPLRRQLSEVDATHVLYHYLQKDLLRDDLWLFQMFVSRLIVALGIWLSPEIYRRFPVLVPFAAREASFRGDRSIGRAERWGTPVPATGVFGDDNSLVKNLPARLEIYAPKTRSYRRRAVGSGFVASHVWRVLDDGTSAALVTHSRIHSSLTSSGCRSRFRSSLTAKAHSLRPSYKHFRGRSITTLKSPNRSHPLLTQGMGSS